MKILSVRFSNLNSLQGEHHIRFDEPPLSESGLFAITGPTGAGKTTILDAITVALYGEVPRHSSGRNIREIMTRHTGECKSEVEFLAHGQQYRATWSLRRSRGKATGEFQSVHMELCLVNDLKPFDLRPSDVPKKVAEIVGLDFQQFLRSVMLSQGDFTRFLMANENERGQLLEKLTDTRIYSQISMAAFEKFRAEQQKLGELQRQLQTDQLLTEEVRQELTAEINTLKTALEANQQQLKNYSEQKTWLLNLSKLTSKNAITAAELALTQEKDQAWQPHRQKLAHHEEALPFQSDLILLTESKRQHQALAQALSDLRNQLPEQENLVRAVTEKALFAEQEQQTAQQKFTEAEPKLDLVLQQDSRLQEQLVQFKKEKTVLSQAQASVQKLKEESENYANQLVHFTAQEKGLSDWLTQNQQDAELSASLMELKAEAKSLINIRAQQEKQRQEKAVLNQNLEKEAQNAESWQTQLGTLSDQLQALQTKLTSLKEKTEQALQGHQPDALENLCQQLPQVCSQLEKQLGISKNYLRVETRWQKIQQQVNEGNQQLHQLRTSLARTTTHYQHAHDKWKDLQHIVDLQRQIQQYEEARTQLQPQQPCPLCGSAHHPYVTEHQPLSLSEAQQNLVSQRQLLDKLLLQEREESAAFRKLEVDQQHQQEQLTDLASESSQLQTGFAELNLALAVTHALDDAATVEQLWQTRKKELETATTTLATLRQLRSESEQAHQTERNLQQEQQRFRHEIEKSNQKHSHVEAQLTTLVGNLKDLEEQENVVYAAVRSFFATYGLSYSGANGKELQAQLEERRDRMDLKKAALPEAKEKRQKASLDVENTQKILSEKQLELETKQHRLTLAEADLQELQQQRYLLLPEGLEPQTEKKRLQEILQIASQNQIAEEKALQKETENLNLLQHQASTKKAEAQATHQRITELEQQLLERISHLHLTTVYDLQARLLPDFEARKLRLEKENLQNSLNQLTHSLAQSQTEYQQEIAHNLTDSTLEEVQTQLDNQEEERNQYLTQSARLEMQLQQDAQLRQKHQLLSQQLEVQKKETQRWERLSSLIGSADGIKFSKYAQSLTLARLVQLGNRHLHRLNDRYRILKSTENQLELQILDTHQGDAVRSVNSLSGGESFLVSLALALGLSDLASHKTQIHSLFIDEGFGTLDAETLDVAMDALESLQASGKMIGIISHVEALKERISTQVIVEKHAAGRSSMKVVSGLTV